MEKDKTPKTVIGFWSITVGERGKEAYEGDTKEDQERITQMLRQQGKVFSLK